MIGWRKDKLYDKTLVFVAGVEGSGTTILIEFLAKPSFAAAIGGLYFSPGYKACQKKFLSVTDYLWDKTVDKDIESIQKKKKIMREMKIPRKITHLSCKRSFPTIITNRFPNLDFPNLSDLFDFARDIKIVVIDRALKSCVASIKRREFTTSIEEAAERIKQGRIHLMRGLANIDKKYYEVFSYEDFIQNPDAHLERLETFIEYPKGSLAPFVGSTIKQPTKEAKNILNEHAAFLDQFFNGFADKIIKCR
jgi:hypothetical protein